ncbi:hypothetical protein D3C75_1008510 [compost metagenome]
MMFMTVTAAAVIAWLVAIRHLFFTQRFKAFFRAVAFVRCTSFQHLVDNRVITIKTFGLVVRTFIPLKTQPIHTIHNSFDSFWG